MKKGNINPEDSTILRQKAEEHLKLRKSETSKIASEADMQKLIHELKVHQIELEMLNEELETAKEKAELAEEKYTRLFDFAPSAYFNLTPDGDISELNLAGAKMLGKERQNLINNKLALFISSDTRVVFDNFLSQVFIRKNFQSCEVTFVTGNDIPIFAHLCGSLSGDRKLCMIIATDITEIRQAKADLDIANVRLQYLLSSTTAVIYTAKPSGDFGTTFTSSNVVQLAGYDPEDFIRDSSFWYNRVHPEDLVIVSDGINRLLKNGKHTCEYRFKCKDGRYIWVRDEMKLVLDNKGNPLEIVGYWTNITERKSLEEIIKKEMQELKLIIDSSPIIIFYNDIEGKFIHVNKTFAEAINLPEEEFVGKTAYDLYSDTIAQSMTNDDREVFESGRPKLNIIEQYESANGIRWVQTEKIPICDKNGTPIGLIGFAQDITERKQAEEALHLEKENFRHSLDDSPLGVRIATIDGNTIYANMTLLNFYGYDSLEELQRTPLKERYTPESFLQAQKRKLQRERGDFSATEYKVSIVRKNGEIRHLQVYRKEVIWDGVRQFQVICNDITSHKQAENEIKKSKELLSDLNKRLETIRENERTNISREFHDQIGQSLTALKIDMISLLEKMKIESREGRMVGDMIKLVNTIIRDVQRISSELRPLMLDDLGLAATLEWYCEEFAERTGLKVKLDLGVIQTDSINKDLALYRVAQESLTNIIRHANAGMVQVSLHKIRNDIVLTIQDDGIGISRDKISSFKSFGLLGMAERVKQHGGKMEILTPDKNGTIIRASIPIK